MRLYELDGVVARKEKSRRMVLEFEAGGRDESVSHKPNSMKIAVNERKWRAIGGDRRKKRIKWELLRDEGKKSEYKEETRRRMEMLMEGGEEKMGGSDRGDG